MDNGGNDHYISLQDRYYFLPAAPFEQCIYRVRNHLRRINEKAYEPEILAIGPYHHGKPNLHLMEEQKIFYLRDLIENGYGESPEQFITYMTSVIPRPGDYYAEPFGTNYSDDSLIEMMVLDGCFIIAFFLKCNGIILVDPDDPIFCTSWIKLSLMRDLLLFENQLPLCVLYELSELLFHEQGNHRLSFVRLAFAALDENTLWGFSGVDFKDEDILTGILPNHEIKHLLGLMHHGFFLSNVLSRDADVLHQQDRNEVNEDMEHDRKLQLLGCFHAYGIRFRRRWDEESQVGSNSDEDEKLIRCAKDLKEAGIKFDKAKGLRICDIKFQNGVIEIPTLRIHDRTESFFRNFIAYEQCGMADRVSTYMVDESCWPNFVPDDIRSKEFSPNFVADNMAFMDRLINSENDVRLLRECGVIDNWMSDDEVVSDMFNKLGDFVVLVDFPSGNYAKIFGEVNRHCSKRWNFHMANLRHNYFNNPWAFVSFLAALVLLSLAFTQALFAMLSFAVHKS